MITQGPTTLTIGLVLPLNDPGANSNNPATAVQIQNGSPFIVNVNVGGAVFTIQSFTAQTVPTAGGGQQMTLDPVASGGSSQSSAANSLVVVWLLAGEHAPMVDGPLTAAAVASGLANAGIAGAGTLISATVTVPAGNGNPFTIANGTYQVWNVGWMVQVTPPTTGSLVFESSGAFDAVTPEEGASNRMAGMFFRVSGAHPIIAQNNMDEEVEAFIVYST